MMKRSVYSPLKASMICSSRCVPKVAVAKAWVSPRVNKDEPWVRGNTLVLKHMTYIESARSIGASDWTIIVRHILPGTISPIVVYFTMRVGTSIITAASLSFLGMGAQPPTPEWGAMLNEARADMVNAPHVALFPSLAIFLTVLAFNLLGDGLRDALDPKIDRQT